jgi:ribonuclease D
MTCLIQLAANSSKEYVIDPLAPEVWESVHLLAPLFADPQIVKIGHSIGGLDVRCLHRDFGIFVINAFDTYEAAQSLRLPSHGLANVCAYYGLPDCEIYVRLKEEYQTTDWTKRPLSQPMLQYGRYDVHYLIRLRKLMMRDLARQELWDIADQTVKDAEARQVATSLAAMLANFDEDEEIFTDDTDKTEFSTPAEASVVYKDAPYEEDPTQDGGERQSFFDARELRMNIDLMHVVSRSQDRCLDLWNDSAEPRLKNSEFQSLLTRCKKEDKDWTTSQLELYARLARWREEIAAKEECTAGFICSLGFLASVALKRPTREIGLRHLNFHLPEVFEETSGNDYINELFQIVSESRGADGLGECDYSAIPSYDEFLERERTGRFSDRSLTLESAGILRVVVAAGLVACVATAVAMTTARGSRMRR